MPSNLLHPATVLVVDDNDSVLLVLSLALEEGGFHVITSASGEEALAVARQSRPDVILLDVMMPNMSGLEVCEHLQADERTRDIPIIFLSARATTPDRVKGLETGAVDYVTKPFDLEEVVSRVRVALRTGRRQRSQEAALDQLKKEFLHLLTHEMATPLTAIRGFSELLETGMSAFDTASQVEYLREIGRSSRHLAGTLDDMLALGEAESFTNREKTDVVRLIRAVAHDLEPERAQNQQTLHIEAPEVPLMVRGHARFLPRAVHALLSNAQKFGGTGTEIRIVVKEQAPDVTITFVDQGPGIDPSLHDRIFDRFYQVDSSRTRRHPGLGLGLAVARRVAHGLGGDVTVDSAPSCGSRFTLRVPSA